MIEYKWVKEPSKTDVSKRRNKDYMITCETLEARERANLSVRGNFRIYSRKKEHKLTYVYGTSPRITI